MKFRFIALGFAMATAVASIGAPAGAAPAEGFILAADSPNAVPGSYIVVMNDFTTASVSSLSAKYGGQVTDVWSDALNGYAANMSERAAKRLAADPAVKYVEQNQIVTLDATQSPTPSWGLDRIDSRTTPRLISR